LLGVFLFIAFWVVLGASVFFLGGRRSGGAQRETRTLSYRGSRALGLTFVAIYIAFGVIVPLLVLHGNHANASAQVGGNKLTAAEKRGRDVFGFRCGFCHTLAAANAIGKVGPNLDSLRPPYSLVLNTINNGCLPNPTSSNSAQACLGEGVMPAAIIQGRQASDVAAFVAKVAGRE
jgi:mono/diheme cytochrome c family protein